MNPLAGIRRMWMAMAQHFRRPSEIDEHIGNLKNAIQGVDESVIRFDEAVREREEKDPFGEFAAAARKSRFG